MHAVVNACFVGVWGVNSQKIFLHNQPFEIESVQFCGLYLNKQLLYKSIKSIIGVAAKWVGPDPPPLSTGIDTVVLIVLVTIVLYEITVKYELQNMVRYSSWIAHGAKSTWYNLK